VERFLGAVFRQLGHRPVGETGKKT
jgi:hypothetical protein